MTITLRQLLLILGATLALVGVLLGVLPLSFDGGTCGLAFGDGRTMDTESLRRTMIGTGESWRAFESGCTDARVGRRTLALTLLVPGLILAAASAFVRGGPGPAEADAHQHG